MNFLKKNIRYTDSAFFLGVTPALYPLLSYYESNYNRLNSWEQVIYFTLICFVAPIVGFFLIKLIYKKTPKLPMQSMVLFFCSALLFSIFILVSTNNFLNKKHLLISVLFLIPIAYFLHRFLKYLVLFQFLIFLIGCVTFIPNLITNLNYNSAWANESIDLVNIKFKKKPNIYFLQADGFVNFGTQQKEPYNNTDTIFKTFLKANKFKHYDNYRSNYCSTLASNSSMLAMKHHYYGNVPSTDDAICAREVITCNNDVLRILKRNGYKTKMILENPYVLLNRPKNDFDYVNISSREIPYFKSAFNIKKNILEDFLNVQKQFHKTPVFYFIEFFKPGHISNVKLANSSIEKERLRWLENLKFSEDLLTQMINKINKVDPNALIIVASDHGGYVGLEYANQMYNDKSLTKDQKASIFAAICAIKWPSNDFNHYDKDLKTSVNLFKIIFSYLSEDLSVLDNLENNSSYLPVKGNIYKYFDTHGNLVSEHLKTTN